jgi:hypothetical protein
MKSTDLLCENKNHSVVMMNRVVHRVTTVLWTSERNKVCPLSPGVYRQCHNDHMLLLCLSI